MVTPEVKRNAIRHLHEHFGRSLRKLCILVGLSRTSWHYEPKPDTNEPIRNRLKEMADERKRWGYRRLHYLLRREGFQINHKRTERLYREENLMLRRVTRRRKTAADTRVAPPKSERRNQCWAMDFSVPQKSGMRDEGSPLAIGLQEQVANHRKQHWSKASVVSVTEKVL